MLTVACVLKGGGEFKPEHVRHLRDGVAKHLSLKYRFVCLTDDPQPDYECILLKHGWPGWWSKLELFRRGLFSEPVFYADLDTVIVGPLDDIVLGHTFTVLRNMWVPEGHPRIGTGLMAWDVELEALYSSFAENPAQHMAEFGKRDPDRHGDQGFIQASWPFPMDRWQQKFPGKVVSYKNGVVKNRGRVPAGAAVVVYHGAPRPWQTLLWGK